MNGPSAVNFELRCCFHLQVKIGRGKRNKCLMPAIIVCYLIFYLGKFPPRLLEIIVTNSPITSNNFTRFLLSTIPAMRDESLQKLSIGQ